MGAVHLAGDSKISDIIGKLDDPDKYLRGVLGNMLACKKEHGTAFARIGTTGRGIVPHYRVEPEFSLEVFDNEELWAARFVAFHGRNHKRLDWGAGELRGEHWSDGNMSYDDVQNLLGSIRGFNRKKA